jgi:DNA-binding HxlR family transcriptional regulator
MSTEVRPCSIARALELVGEKWTLLAVREMLLGSHRFDEIVRFTGAPRDILTSRLRKLEGAGLARRVQYQERPPRFEYHLTAQGQALRPVVATLREWGDQYLAGEEGPPMTFRHACGSDFHPAIACRACGQIATPQDVVIASAAPRPRTSA